MKNVSPKIKFYSIGTQKIDFSKLNNELSLDMDKDVVVSESFNKALNTVINKDIKFLKNKVDKIINDINELLVINQINDIKLSGNINYLDDLNNDVELIISKLIVEKESIKFGIFRTKRKAKKKKYNDLEECINKIMKYQKELILVKNEYNKLDERKTIIKDVIVEDDEAKDKKEELDPLERTINFYMNKSEN